MGGQNGRGQGLWPPTRQTGSISLPAWSRGVRNGMCFRIETGRIVVTFQQVYDAGEIETCSPVKAKTWSLRNCLLQIIRGA